MSRRTRLLLTAGSTFLIMFALAFAAKKPLVVSASAQMEEVAVEDNLVITHSVRLKRGEYHLQDKDGDGIIKIERDGITIDASGVTIISDDGHGKPDGKGIGVLMNNHHDVTLRNLNIQGYETGIKITQAKNITIEASQVSDSFYGMVIEHAENILVQYSNISNNHKDMETCFLVIETGRLYGGGILFDDVQRSIVRDNILTNQSTGLEMIHSDDNQVFNNTTSIGPEGNEEWQNSCWGIRMESSSNNLVRGNLADYVDRERYVCPDVCRNQPNPSCSVHLESGDSAGILLVLGSNNNRIISNSLRHSGDGFFIGNLVERASYNNYVYGNDGTGSPHNAFECTFSGGNKFENNIASESNHGFWLGYSNHTTVLRNQINNNSGTGINVDHGNNNEFGYNNISGNNVAGIWLSANFPAAYNDPPSHDYQIHHNNIVLNNQAIHNHDTDDVYVFRNQLVNNSDNSVLIQDRTEGNQTSDRVNLWHNNLECRDSSMASSENLAWMKPTTSNRKGSMPEQAVDGVVFDATSCWYPTDNPFPPRIYPNDYWQVDLGEEKTIAELMVYPYYINVGDFTRQYHIDVSRSGDFAKDGVRVVTETSRPMRPVVIYDFTPVRGQYIRLTSDEERGWSRMMELAAFETQGNLPSVQCSYTVYNDNPTDVSALHNWWNRITSMEIDELIYDRLDDKDKGYVFYHPFLLEPILRTSGAYDPRLSAWSQTEKLPRESAAPFSMRGQQLVFYNNRIYVFGGRNSSNDHLQDVYYSSIRPDGTLTKWESTTPLPKDIYDQVVVRVGNHMYLLTGAAGSTAVYCAAVQANGTLGGWLPTSPLNSSRQNFAATTYGNYIYVTGGNAGGTRDFVQYAKVNDDGNLDNWQDAGALPEAVEAHTMAAYDGFIYVIAPHGEVFYAAIDPKDGMVKTWMQTTSLPQALNGSATFEYDGYLYVLGGDSSTVYYTEIKNDGQLPDWQETTSLPEPLRGMRVGASNGYVYGVGGYDGTNYRSDVLYTQLEVPGGCDGGENLNALFSGGTNAALTKLTYDGLATVTVSGVGQASGGDFSDAFYIFADKNGNPIPPSHPTEQYNWVLSINGDHAEILIRNNYLPAYRPDHRYSFQIVAPDGPLWFGVGDAYTADNTGSYRIGLCGGTP